MYWLIITLYVLKWNTGSILVLRYSNIGERVIFKLMNFLSKLSAALLSMIFKNTLILSY